LNVYTLQNDCTVRVGPLFNIPALLLELGCDPGPIFERNGFTLDDFKDTEHRISYLKGSQLIADCVVTAKCEHFGLRLAQMATPSYLGIIGYMSNAASTVGQALKTLVEFMDLHDDGATVALHVEENYSRLSFHIHQPGVSAAAQICDLSVAYMCKIMRSLCGKDWNASQVMVARNRPRDVTPYTRYFRTSVLFDSVSCGIVFPNHYLQIKPPGADELLYHHLELEANLFHQMQHHEIMEMLPSVLQRGLLLNQFSASDIADSFGIQERTLHRRLQSEGTSFRHELDQVRESMSMQLLETSSLPICDIAIALGYADSSGFVRAFHRWVGVSPASWRKQNSIKQAPDHTVSA